ncbi:MAG: hypothetical protein HON94_12020 [Methylococcales bacterium]|jgi:hypothetical protein|nr:hypothetical protein [Methylococcales bacterium]MBT7409455.1 hypothetical protein [Methylococcales bacterium]
MPYFIYKIKPPKRLEYISSHEKFPEAKKIANEMRLAQSADDDSMVKIIFAKTPEDAEKDLMVEREPIPMGELMG